MNERPWRTSARAASMLVRGGIVFLLAATAHAQGIADHCTSEGLDDRATARTPAAILSASSAAISIRPRSLLRKTW